MEVWDLFAPSILIPWLLGMLFGIFVGATPGLTATMAVALIVPFSYHLPDTNASLALIIGVSFTAIFAGDIPATLLRIPGTPASAAATLDGHAMAKKGKASLALFIDLFCSSLGGMVGVAALVFLAPQLGRLALKFTSYEYFWLGILGLGVSAIVSGRAVALGWLSAALGMGLSMVGMDIVSGAQRFTMGSAELMNGIEFIPVMIGLFGISEVLRNLGELRSDVSSSSTSSAKPPPPVPSDVAEKLVGSNFLSRDLKEMGLALRTIWKHKWNFLRSSLTGSVIGALPGAGADIAAWGAYGAARKLSKNPNEFGSGIADGVIAPTSANNAAVGGAWIPALVFGIPGDAVTAIVLGAFMVYDIRPGPMLFEQDAARVTGLFWIAFLTQFFLIPCGYLGVKFFSWILKAKRALVLGAVILFSVVGSYSLRNSLFDVWVMLVFGVVGRFMEARKAPLAPLILGLILGPMIEENLRTGLIKSSGSWAPFFQRPISLLFVSIIALTAAATAISKMWGYSKANPK